MNRRHLLAAPLAAPLLQSQSGWSNAFAKTWRDSFAEHWRDTKEYTLSILDAMPADGFTSKPDPAQRTFGGQFTHLAMANVVYFRAFGLVPPDGYPQSSAEMAKAVNDADKAAVRKFVVDSFDYCANVLAKMSEKDMTRSDLNLFKGARPHSGTDVCMRAYMHTAHHRGQAVVYLRVKSITPPAWKFEPKT